MSSAERLKTIPVEVYLRGEAISPVKHEYVGGIVYAMAGATNAHNLVATNVLIALGGQLRGTSCRAFNSDTKIRIEGSGVLRPHAGSAALVSLPDLGIKLPLADVYEGVQLQAGD